MNKYRIVRWEKYDENGGLKDSYFYIEKSKKIFDRTFWTYIWTTAESADRSIIRVRMKFNLITSAQHFIEDVLVPNKPYNTEVNKVMETYESQPA